MKNARFSENSYVVSRLKNQTGTAEGSNLPPRQVGEFRVPFVSNLRLIRSEKTFGNTTFTIAWEDPQGVNISHYAVYVINGINANQPPLGPYITQVSPAQIPLPSQAITRVVFLVQTVLKNGLVSDFDSSPTCTGLTTDDTDTISITSLAHGTAGQLISWDSGGLPVTFGPGTADRILVGSGAGALPQFKTAGALNLVLGASSLTALGQIVYVASSGTVTALAAGAADAFLVGSGAGVAPQFKTGSTLDLVIGRSTLTTNNGVTYVTASGTIGETAAGATDNILVGAGGASAPLFKSISTLDLVLGYSSISAGKIPYGSATGTLTTLTSGKLAEATVSTTDATVTTLQTIAAPATTTIRVQSTVVARRTGGAAGTAEDGASYVITGTFKNVAGVATQIGTTSVVSSNEDQAGWDCVYDVTGATARIRVTGAVDNNVNWVAVSTTTQVS